jgi:hypothetical protein
MNFQILFSVAVTTDHRICGLLRNGTLLLWIVSPLFTSACTESEEVCTPLYHGQSIFNDKVCI